MGGCTMSFHNAVVYDNFAHLLRYEFDHVRDEKENKLSRTRGSRDSPCPLLQEQH